ncbi:MAG: hypothetical protein ACKOFW_02340, partial [Planctomycetaceae bacterium]
MSARTKGTASRPTTAAPPPARVGLDAGVAPQAVPSAKNSAMSPATVPGGLAPSAEFRAALAARPGATPPASDLTAVTAGTSLATVQAPAPASVPTLATAPAQPHSQAQGRAFGGFHFPKRVSPPEVTRWLAVATGFCIPIATSPAEVLTGCFVLSWLLTERPWQRLGGLVSERQATGVEPGGVNQPNRTRGVLARIEWARVGAVVGWGPGLALALFALLALGVGWSTAGWERGVRCLLKYRELLLLPLFDQVFKEPAWRRRGASAFLAGCSVLLAMSCVEWLTQLDFGLARNNLPTNYVVTKDRIIHGLLMSLLTYLSVGAAWQRRDRWSWLLLALAGCAIWN